MKRILGIAVAACFSSSVLALAQAGDTVQAPTAKLHTLDPKTPQGLQELFKLATERLPLVSAHRGGAAKGYPENCLATFEQTLRYTWSMLEIDLRYTKDGIIVLHHDPTLNRTTSGTGRVEDHTLQELRQLRLKDRYGKPTEYCIPTLDETIEWARGKTILILDKKEVPVKDVVQKIEEHRAESYTMLMAYSIEDIAQCYSMSRNVMMEIMLGNSERFDAFEKTGVPWSNIIAFVGHTPTPDAQLCRRIRAKGASCMAGSSRNVDRRFLDRQVADMEALRPDYNAMLRLGADIIETDIPRELGPLLYGGQPVPASKTKFFHAGRP